MLQQVFQAGFATAVTARFVMGVAMGIALGIVLVIIVTVQLVPPCVSQWLW